ncbi:MAG: AAA family ATPase [Bacilli bacterium]|jgi:pilus assembly protein CpaE
MAREKGKAIAVFSTKGGVGKTIFTLNLGGTYSLLKKKTLIIDLDLYSGGIALSLNLKQTKDIYNLALDLNNNRYKEFNDYTLKYNDYLDVLACPKDPRQGSKIENKYIEIILANALNLYDVVLIDTSHVLNEINLTALSKVDKITLLLSNDPVDVKNMKSMISILKDSNFDNYIVILNDALKRDKDIFGVFEIKNIIKNNIDYTIPPSFYFKNIDSFTLKGEIPLLNKRIRRLKYKDYDRYQRIADFLIDARKEDEY